MNRYIKKIVLLFVLVTVAFSLSACDGDEKIKVYPREQSPLIVKFFDVGQGDCELIQLPDSRNIIIDAGKRAGGEALVERLKDLGVEKFEYVVATHPHEDHIGGMSDVINNFEIGTFYMPDAVSTTDVFENMLDSIETKGVEVRRARAGLTIVDEENLKIKLVAPVGEEYGDKNNYSAVVKLTYYDKSFLFTGDAERLSETEMLESGASLKSDVLKVGHHGSDTSTSVDFLNAVSPEYAVIEVGEDNSYGHPDEKILKRLKNVKVYRTDIHGDITFECDGENISVTTEYSED